MAPDCNLVSILDGREVARSLATSAYHLHTADCAIALFVFALLVGSCDVLALQEFEGIVGLR